MRTIKTQGKHKKTEKGPLFNYFGFKEVHDIAFGYGYWKCRSILHGISTP